jgi:pimeloyl-ACP methyl ester carboxylesterase
VPDARVTAAVANWAPRLVAQGVDANDFRRTTAGLERWNEWLDAWCETAAVHRSLAEEAEAAGHAVSAGEAYVRAALCFHFAKFVWLVDRDRHRHATEQAVACLLAAHRTLDPGARRIEVPFGDARLVGNLRVPAGVERPTVVLLVPGLDSAKEEFFWWEDVFLRRGLATFSFDGPGQGESGLSTTIRPDYEAPAAAALDALAAAAPGLGPVGAAGVSLGGYYAPRAAAGEPRIRAVAGVSGPFNFGACWDGLPGLTRETFVHHSGAADDEDGRARALRLDLEPVIDGLTQPALLVTGGRDRIIPWEQTRRIAERAPNARFVLFEEANHVCNDMPYRYRPLVADWLGEQLRRVG